MADEIIRELWAVKDQIAREHNYDIGELVKTLKRLEAESDHRFVDLRQRKRLERKDKTNRTSQDPDRN